MTIVLCCAMLLTLLLRSAACAQAARQALIIWGRDVVPSLFPYMVLCRMLARRLKTMRIPAAPAAVFLGLCGGSPSGAAVLASYSDELKDKALFPLCALTGTISPVFFLSTIHAWTQNVHLDRMLLAAHYGGAIACALTIKAFLSSGKSNVPLRSAKAQESPEQSPIMESVDAILSVGGCIIFYSVAAAALLEIPLLRGVTGALLHAVLETAGGMHAVIAVLPPDRALGVCLAAVSGFSGLSILSQNLYFLRPLGVRMQHLLLFGLLRALYGALFMAVFFVP